MPGVLLRLALVLSAAVIVGLLALRLADERRCAATVEESLALVVSERRAPAEIADRARESCGDIERRALVALGLAGGGHERLGSDLMRDAVAQSPESFVAWSTLARIERSSGERPGEADRRARALNPLWEGPLPLPRLGDDPPAAG